MQTPAVMTWVLVIIVLVGFSVEATIGFGATLVAVTLGAFVVPLPVLLPPFVLVNLALSGWIVLWRWRDVRWSYLGLRVVPWMALGVPLGVVAAARLDATVLLRALGIFVATLSVAELLPRRRGARAPLPSSLASPLLWLGGALHGAFASGGPLAVYVAGRDLADKEGFRATLSALWLLLNAALVAGYAASGLVTAASAQLAAAFVPSLAAGAAVGEWAHRRLPLETFQRLAFSALTGAGLVLALR